MKRLILITAYVLPLHWLFNVQPDTVNRVCLSPVASAMPNTRHFHIGMLGPQFTEVQRNTNPLAKLFIYPTYHLSFFFNNVAPTSLPLVNSSGNHKLFSGNHNPATFP